MWTVRSKALQRAADLVGGRHALRATLGVSLRDLERWLDGGETPPLDVFLKSVDIIAAAPQRARRASETRESAIAAWEAAADMPPPKPLSVLGFLQASYAPGEGGRMVQDALGAAVAATGADMGTLQVARADGLLLVAQRGFDRPFLEYFACVHDEGACGAAAKKAQRVIVSDVPADPIFAGTVSADVMAEAHARAVQSTPLVTGSGELVGMLSTHRDRAWQPARRELEVIDHIARRAAWWLDGGPL